MVWRIWVFPFSKSKVNKKEKLAGLHPNIHITRYIPLNLCSILFWRFYPSHLENLRLIALVCVWLHVRSSLHFHWTKLWFVTPHAIFSFRFSFFFSFFLLTLISFFFIFFFIFLLYFIKLNKSLSNEILLYFIRFLQSRCTVYMYY